MKNKYRIVNDDFAGYEVQIRYWWLPFFWFQKWHNGTINTWANIIDAKKWIDGGCKRKQKKPVKKVYLTSY